MTKVGHSKQDKANGNPDGKAKGAGIVRHDNKVDSENTEKLPSIIGAS